MVEAREHKKYYLQIVLSNFLLEGTAVIAQLGERKTEDLKVSGSIPDCGSTFGEPRGQSVRNLPPLSEISLSSLKFFLNSE